MQNLQASDSGVLYGLNVKVVGHEGPRPWIFPSGKIILAENSWPLLGTYLGQLDVEQTINLIAGLSALNFKDHEAFAQNLERGGIPRGTTLRDYQLVIILTQLLSQSSLPKSGGLQTSIKDLVTLGAMVLGGTCQADIRSIDHAFVQRYAHQQFWDQEDYSVWNRGILIQREIHKILKEKERFALNDAYKHLFGMTLDHFVFYCFALFSVGVNQPGRVFGPQQFLASTDFAMDEDEVIKFFSHISLEIPAFRTNALKPAVYIQDYEPYCISPLVRWPVIRLSNGQHSLPVPRLMLDRATTGTYYDFLPLLTPQEASKFGRFWGSAFEAYVGEVMRQTDGVTPPKRAETVASDQEICDWVIFEDSVVLLIECKTRTLSARSRITGEERDLRRDVSAAAKGNPYGTSLSKGLVQLMRTRDAIERDNPGRFKFICLMVTLDKIYLANATAWLHRILEEEAEKLYGDKLPEAFQVTDIAGFERLLQLVTQSGRPITTHLSEKMVDRESFQLDLMTYVGLAKSDKLDPLPYLHSISDSSMLELVEEFRAYST
jgi:hypothetical protein